MSPSDVKVSPDLLQYQTSWSPPSLPTTFPPPTCVWDICSFHSSGKPFFSAIYRKIFIIQNSNVRVIINCWTNRLSCILLKGEADMINSQIARSVDLATSYNSLGLFQYHNVYDVGTRFMIGDQQVLRADSHSFYSSSYFFSSSSSSLICHLYINMFSES